jgi:hypothetical protein
MSNTKEILRHMNPELFATTQVAEPYDALISVAEVVNDAEGEGKSFKFAQKSKKDIPGMPKSVYFRASFTKTDSVIDTLLDSGITRPGFKGSKKPQAGNIFKNQQPSLFNRLAIELTAKRFEESGKDSDGHIQVTPNMMVFGKKVSVSVPIYKPQDDQGSLKGTRYDPKTRKYVENQPVSMGVYRFFADVDDLEELIDVAAKLVDRWVMPFVTETVTIIKETAGSVSKETKESSLSAEEEIAAANTTPEEEEVTV